MKIWKWRFENEDLKIKIRNWRFENEDLEIKTRNWRFESEDLKLKIWKVWKSLRKVPPFFPPGGAVWNVLYVHVQYILLVLIENLLNK